MKLTIESDKNGPAAVRELISGLGSLDYHLGHIGDSLERETTDVSISMDGRDMVLGLRLSPKPPTAKTNGKVNRIVEVAAVRQDAPTDPTDAALTVDAEF